MGLDITVCPRCKKDLINLLHCHYCNWPKSRSAIKGVADDDQITLNKVPDTLLNQEPNDNSKGIFDMKYFLFYYSSDCCGFEQEGPFENKVDVMNFIENNIAIDTPLKEIVLVKGERILLKRIITEA